VKLISWNIQWCRGMDGTVDSAAIARVVRACDADVICFQEVARNFAALEGSAGEDQAELLAQEFRGYSTHTAWAVDLPEAGGGRRQYGNMILSRLPVGRVLRHSLPWPTEDGVPSMPRVALEATILAPWGKVAVTTTHLEFYSKAMRAAQCERLRELRLEALADSHTGASSRETGAAFEHSPRAASSILTGDFNMRPSDPLVARLLETWRDAWQVRHPGAPHPPSFFVHDTEKGIAPYCCDYVMVSEDLAPRLASVRIDGETQASDHQPVIVEFR
jgi:endonuclease/exonuclease/phosphatase family metal-dependent hydrolase